jgi:predicted RNA polymerase sigma factor
VKSAICCRFWVRTRRLDLVEDALSEAFARGAQRWAARWNTDEPCRLAVHHGSPAGGRAVARRGGCRAQGTAACGATGMGVFQ